MLGATSQIAKDLVLSFSEQSNHELALFARRPEVVTKWLASVGLTARYSVADFAAFSSVEHFNAIINFVGVGNPAQAAAMGASIFDVTATYDELALGYLRHHPACQYIFLSSGAAYGSSFDEPADVSTKAKIAINNVQPQDWYGVAKLHAECRHRALLEMPIVDLRVFNYFSQSQNLAARFFITDALRAIRDGGVLEISSEPMVRDYLGPEDFFQLVYCVLNALPVNDVVDCYTLAPVRIDALLAALQQQFGLQYQARSTAVGVNATGFKAEYYSTNRRASRYGYQPSMTSLETVIKHARKALGA